MRVGFVAAAMLGAALWLTKVCFPDSEVYSWLFGGWSMIDSDDQEQLERDQGYAPEDFWAGSSPRHRFRQVYDRPTRADMADFGRLLAFDGTIPGAA